MSKIIGRKVRLVKTAGDLSGQCLADRHDVGAVLTIVDISFFNQSKWPVQCRDSNYGYDVYKPEQLRYLNNRRVVL